MRLRAQSIAALISVLVLTGCASAGDLASPRAGDPTSSQTLPGTPSNSTSHTPSTPSGTGFDATPHDFADISEVLAARARALVAGNETGFLATVDEATPAFYAAQKIVFENLQDLPVTSISYDVGTSGLPNAPGITGGPLLSPPIVEHVYFADTDQRPVANEVDETFVRRDGHWLMAADSLHSQPGEVTARPWDSGRIDVVVHGHLIVVTDASSGLAQSVANTVVADLTADADVLDVPVDDHLMVDATTSGGVETFDNNEPAGAVTFAVTSITGGKTGLAGYRVKLNPSYITQILQDPALLRHELTHFLMFRYSGAVPTWLNEGLADYVGHQPAGLSSEYMTPSTYDRLMRRPQVLTVSGLFGQDPDTDYPLAMACVTYLVDHGGIAKVEALMQAYLAFPGEPYGDEHTDRLLHQVFGLSSADVAHGAFALLAALR